MNNIFPHSNRSAKFVNIFSPLYYILSVSVSVPLNCSLPSGVEETREMREKMGIMVHYNVKVRCVVAFGG